MAQNPKQNQKEIYLLLLFLIFGIGLIFLLTSSKKPTSLFPTPTPNLSLSPTQNTESLPPATPSETTLITQDFSQVISQLNTPEKLVEYLNKNCKLEDREEEKPREPKEFFEKKRGTQWDFAIFTSYILWKNHYDSAIIRYKYGEGKINVVVVFRDKDLPKTIIFNSQGVSMYAHGWSFEEMLQKEEKRLGEKISEYSVSYWTDKEELWPEEWIKRTF